MDCCQPKPKPPMTDYIAEMAAKHFGIEDDKSKSELQFLLDFYADVKVNENLIKFFQSKRNKYGNETVPVLRRESEKR